MDIYVCSDMLAYLVVSYNINDDVSILLNILGGNKLHVAKTVGSFDRFEVIRSALADKEEK